MNIVVPYLVFLGTSKLGNHSECGIFEDNSYIKTSMSAE